MSTHTQRAYFPALDGLRAVAVTLVFLQHYVIPHLPTASFSWGWVGVDIFFVLSGFLITGILFDSASLPHALRNFYVRRALRIFPLYYGAFLVLLLLTPLFHWDWNGLWLLWPVYLGNLARFLSIPLFGHMGTDSLRSADGAVYVYLGHFWSLCVEEQFYLIWPLVVLAVRSRRRLLTICAAVILLSPLLRVAALYLAPSEALSAELLYRLLPFRADALLIGGALALLVRSPTWPRTKTFLPTIVLVTAGIFLVTRTIAILVFHQSAAPAVTVPWLGTIGFSLIDIFAAGVIGLCIEQRTLVARLLSAPPLTGLGRISYGFYVLHDIPHSLYASAVAPLHLAPDVSPFCVALLAYIATLILATLSFRFFEAPILRHKDRFTLRSTVPSPHP